MAGIGKTRQTSYSFLNSHGTNLLQYIVILAIDLRANEIAGCSFYSIALHFCVKLLIILYLIPYL